MEKKSSYQRRIENQYIYEKLKRLALARPRMRVKKIRNEYQEMVKEYQGPYEDDPKFVVLGMLCRKYDHQLFSGGIEK